MHDVLVVTLPPRNYAYKSKSSYNDTVSSFKCPHLRLAGQTCFKITLTSFFVFECNGQINDYVAGYHDGALLFGKVLREKMLSEQQGRNSDDLPPNYNPFGNMTFEGEYDLYHQYSRKLDLNLKQLYINNKKLHNNG